MPNGGNFDGDPASLSALGVPEALTTPGLRTRHPLEMVVWANEEGVAFGDGLAGSRVVAGDVKADMNQLWNGTTRAGAAVALLLLIGVIAGWIPGRRAARIRPMESLSSD